MSTHFDLPLLDLIGPVIHDDYITPYMDQTSGNIEMHPEFYECPTPEHPVLIKPTPSPRSQHDPLPQTVLAECIRNCRFL